MTRKLITDNVRIIINGKLFEDSKDKENLILEFNTILPGQSYNFSMEYDKEKIKFTNIKANKSEQYDKATIEN